MVHADEGSHDGGGDLTFRNVGIRRNQALDDLAVPLDVNRFEEHAALNYRAGLDGNPLLQYRIAYHGTAVTDGRLLRGREQRRVLNQTRCPELSPGAHNGACHAPAPFYHRPLSENCVDVWTRLAQSGEKLIVCSRLSIRGAGHHRRRNREGQIGMKTEPPSPRFHSRLNPQAQGKALLRGTDHVSEDRVYDNCAFTEKGVAERRVVHQAPRAHRGYLDKRVEDSRTARGTRGHSRVTRAQVQIAVPAEEGAPDRFRGEVVPHRDPVPALGAVALPLQNVPLRFAQGSPAAHRWRTGFPGQCRKKTAQVHWRWVLGNPGDVVLVHTPTVARPRRRGLLRINVEGFIDF